jgi:hypothetical protein
MQYDAYRELTSNFKQIRNRLGHDCATTGEKHPAGSTQLQENGKSNSQLKLRQEQKARRTKSQAFSDSKNPGSALAAGEPRQGALA